MAQQTLNATAGGPDDNLPTATAKLNSMFGELYALQSKTLNAADPRFAGATNEISINNAINMPGIGAVATGARRVSIPGSMLPFNPSQVTFNNAVQMVREGGDWSTYDIQAYGGACDGVAGAGTDDTAAWLAAIAVAHANQGTIAHSGLGESLITASLTLPLDSQLSIIGVQGNATIKAKTGAAPFGPMLSIDGTAFGSRLGILRDLLLDGNHLATQGLALGLCVERTFQNITVNNCTQWGLGLKGAQNNTFVSCNIEENGTTGALDTNLLLDLGAGNNVFLRCEFAVTEGASQRGQYNVVIRQSGVSPTGGFATPQDNRFYGCIVERSSSTHLGAILQRAGRNNSFTDCAFQTSGARREVTVNSADGASSYLMLTNCILNGTLASSIAVSAVGTEAPAVVATNFFAEGFATGFEIADTTNVEIVAPFQVGSVTTLVAPTGTDTAPGLLVQRGFLRIDGTPSSTTGAPPVLAAQNATLYDATHQSLWIYQGAWQSIDSQALQPFTTWTAGTVTINCASGKSTQINISGTGAWTLANPSNAKTNTLLIVDFFNSSGGVAAVPTLGSAWKVAGGALVMPANGLHRGYIFLANPFGGGALFQEICRGATDVPN